MELHAEYTEVAHWLELTSALGSQEIMGIQYTLVLQQLYSLHDPLGKEGCNFLPQRLFYLQL